MMPLRTKILLLLLILSLILYLSPLHQPSLNDPSKEPFHNNDKDNGAHFDAQNFDKALLINGPKLSQFEDEEDRMRSYQAVRKEAALLFHSHPEADKKDDTDTNKPNFYLRSDLVIPEVFYLWCSSNDFNQKASNWFEYKHYLAVSSALEALHPDKLFIFYDKLMDQDRTIYHQWLDNLKKEFSGLYLYTMRPEEASQYCNSDSRASKLNVVFSLLDFFGGLYIGENTWLLNYSPLLRQRHFDFAYDIDRHGVGDGYVMMKKGLYSEFKKQERLEGEEAAEAFVKVYYEKFTEARRKDGRLEKGDGGLETGDGRLERGDGRLERGDGRLEKREKDLEGEEDSVKKVDGEEDGEEDTRNNTNNLISFSSCYSVQHLYNDEDIKTHGRCLIVKADSFDRFYPMDIWQLDDPFGRLTRKIYYGSERVRLPVPNYNTLVPNIGHMIWLGGRDMDYVFYLSLLSLLFVAQVEVVYVHGNTEPGGELWRELKGLPQTRDRITFITRSIPYFIYQEAVEPYYYSLMSDLIRVDLMIKYGGIYTDTDAIWVRPLSVAERGYDAVASYDWIDWSWPYQDTVNFGVSYGKRDAPFWRVFRDSMRKLHNQVRGFTGVMMPYKLLEKHPELLRIDRRLSVICYHSRCHPTYFPGYHHERRDHTNTHSIPNWRRDVHAFHWTHPNPRELFNKTVLLRSQGIFAEMGRNVLSSAGLL